jgi:hypothetical protein
MELKELLEYVYLEAYKLGKEDGLNGLHINPKALFKQYLEEQTGIAKSDGIESYLQELKTELVTHSLH